VPFFFPPDYLPFPRVYLLLVQRGDARPATVLLQRLQGEGVGFYLAVPAIHLFGPAKIVKSLVCHQEHQNLVFALNL
jgi:hypothetical protein